MTNVLPTLRRPLDVNAVLTGSQRDIDLSSAELVNVETIDAEFTKVNFANTEFGLGKVTNTHFVDCDFTNTKFLSTRFYNVTFTNCTLQRTRFTMASLANVSAVGCDFLHSILYDAYVDTSFALPTGYVRSTVESTLSPPWLARVYVDYRLLQETARFLKIDFDIVSTMILEHDDLSPADVLALLPAIFSEPHP